MHVECMSSDNLHLEVRITRETGGIASDIGCMWDSWSGISGSGYLGGGARPHLPLSVAVPASPLARLSTAMARNTFNRMSSVSSGSKSGEAAYLQTTQVLLSIPRPQVPAPSPPKLPGYSCRR